MACGEVLGEECLQDLKENEDFQLRSTEEEFGKMCREAVREIMQESFSDEEVDLNLEYYLTGKGTESSFKEPETQEKFRKREEVLEAVSVIHALYQRSTHAYKTCYLFLNAPWESSNRHFEEDRDANEDQNENMYCIFHDTEESRKENPKEHFIVETKADIQKSLRRIFSLTILNTKRITIVFNGEGYQGDKGNPMGSLCLHRERQPLHMKDFFEMIVATWEAAVTDKALSHATRGSTGHLPSSALTTASDGTQLESMETEAEAETPYNTILDKIPPLPGNVSVILGQCYSHTGSRPPVKSEWGSELTRFPLTSHNVREGKAMCEYRFDYPFKRKGILRKLIKSQHLELNYFAQQNKTNCAYGQQ